MDGDVIRSWELYGATAGVVLEEGSCLALAAEGDADGPRRADDGHADRACLLRLAAWCLLDQLAHLGDERRLVLDVRDVRAVARRERDVQQALRAAVGAGGRLSGHLCGVHESGVSLFGVVDVHARALELAVEAALHAGRLTIGGTPPPAPYGPQSPRGPPAHVRLRHRSRGQSEPARYFGWVSGVGRGPPKRL